MSENPILHNKFGNESASESEIEDCFVELFEEDFPLLPDDYVRFLRIHNGWSFNGISLFGTHRVDHICSLPEGNRNYCRTQNLDGRLVLGTKDDELILFDWEKHEYQMADRMDGMVFDVFENFASLWAFVNRGSDQNSD